MFEYLLKSGLCLALLLAFYHLVLEKEKMHRFNRFYLLGSVLFSFIAPSVIIYIEATNEINQLVTYSGKIVTTNQSFFDQYITIENILITIYTLVSLVFLIRFAKNLYHIIYKIRINEIIKSDFAKFVPVSDTILPHTFWNYIFINKEESSNTPLFIIIEPIFDNLILFFFARIFNFSLYFFFEVKINS